MLPFERKKKRGKVRERERFEYCSILIFIKKSKKKDLREALVSPPFLFKDPTLLLKIVFYKEPLKTSSCQQQGRNNSPSN